MTLRSSKAVFSAIAIVVGSAVLLSAPASAGSRKHKSHPAVSGSAATSRYSGHWGANLVQDGPLYNGPDYLGTDPDPNIRFQILRDLTGRYGGGGD